MDEQVVSLAGLVFRVFTAWRRQRAWSPVASLQAVSTPVAFAIIAPGLIGDFAGVEETIRIG